MAGAGTLSRARILIMALLELKNLHVALEDGTEIVKGVDLAVKSIGHGEGDRDRRERDDQSRAELAEVLDERGFLAVAKAPREPAHRVTKSREAGTRPRSGAAALASRPGR